MATCRHTPPGPFLDLRPAPECVFQQTSSESRRDAVQLLLGADRPGKVSICSINMDHVWHTRPECDGNAGHCRKATPGITNSTIRMGDFQ